MVSGKTKVQDYMQLKLLLHCQLQNPCRFVKSLVVIVASKVHSRQTFSAVVGLNWPGRRTGGGGVDSI